MIASDLATQPYSDSCTLAPIRRPDTDLKTGSERHAESELAEGKAKAQTLSTFIITAVCR